MLRSSSSRRQFVKGGLAAATSALGASCSHGGAGPGASIPDASADAMANGKTDSPDGADELAGDAAPAIPEGTIIDCHTHFYDSANGDRYLPPEYAATVKPLGVTGTVVVEGGWDNDSELALAKDNPIIGGYSGSLPIGSPGFKSALESYARNRFFRGIRVRNVYDRIASDANLLSDFKQMADLDLQLDAFIFGAAEIEQISDLARRLPALRIVIGHLANYEWDGKTFAPGYVAALQAAAKNPNVYIKASWMIESTGKKDGTAPTDVGFYQPLLDAVWQAFGDDRVIYASNCPVCLPYASYAAVLQLAKDYVRARGKAATESFFWRNSLTAYKWVVR